MKIKLQIAKHRQVLFESTYDMKDAEDFGQACSDAFSQLRSQEIGKTTSVGAMMDMLDLSVLDVLDGAAINISRA